MRLHRHSQRKDNKEQKIRAPHLSFACGAYHLKWRQFIKVSGHIICSLAISGIIYFVFKSLALFFVSLAAGVLIDIDHILDYYIQEGVTFKIKNIYRWCAEMKLRFLFIFFHSFELIFLFWVIIYKFKLGIFWIVFAVGLTQHFMLDILFNPIHSYSYFLSYRIMRGFKREYLLRKL